MIQTSKQTDEWKEVSTSSRKKASDEVLIPLECWCLHGAVGTASDWRPLANGLAEIGISTRAVDLWRFLEFGSVTMPEFGKRLNADAEGEVSRGRRRVLIGYSMGGRLALHALSENGPWDAAVIISANPGLRDPQEISTRRAIDTLWATQALTLGWDDFLGKWNAQPILGAAMRGDREDKKLIQRRREIARSFVDWSVANQPSLWDRLHEIQIPMLWIAGERDEKFSEIAKEAVSLLPNAQLALAPEAGHRVPSENGNWLAEEIGRWLGTALAPPKSDSHL